MRCKNVLCGAAVSSARKVEQGDAFLPGVDMADIESLHAGSTDYKVKCMLQAARLKAMQFIGADIQSSQNCKKYRLCVTAASGCRRHQTHTRREESWKAMPPLLNKKKQAKARSWQKSDQMRFSTRLVDCKDCCLSH